MTMTYELDATDQSLGRLASKIAVLLRGKNLPSWQPHLRADVQVIVHNIAKMLFTGNKLKPKRYYHYSGSPGGMKVRTLGDLWAKKPQEVVRMSVYRMLPKNRTRDIIIKNLSFK